jgi:hypothetical protein
VSVVLANAGNPSAGRVPTIRQGRIAKKGSGEVGRPAIASLSSGTAPSSIDFCMPTAEGGVQNGGAVQLAISAAGSFSG